MAQSPDRRRARRSDPKPLPEGPLAQLMEPLVNALGSAVASEKSNDPFQRDPKFVARFLPVIDTINFYYGTKVRGFEHVPKRGPFMIVGNHSGGATTMDAAFFLSKWFRERGTRAPLYGLAYDLLFSVPPFATVLRRFGIVPANPGNARRAIEMGAAVVVFPGGDYEVFRPWNERNQIRFGGHSGFVRIALETGVPVVPMTIHGAHQSTLVLTRGRQIAQLMGIDRLNVKVFPLIWNIPLGLTPAFVPSVQLPSKVTVEFGTPLEWSHHGRRGAKNPNVVKQCYDEITEVMQRTLDRLAKERPYPVLDRVTELRIRRLLRNLQLPGATQPRRAKGRPRASTRANPKRPVGR